MFDLKEIQNNVRGLLGQHKQQQLDELGKDIEPTEHSSSSFDVPHDLLNDEQPQQHQPATGSGEPSAAGAPGIIATPPPPPHSGLSRNESGRMLFLPIELSTDQEMDTQEVIHQAVKKLIRSTSVSTGVTSENDSEIDRLIREEIQEQMRQAEQEQSCRCLCVDKDAPREGEGGGEEKEEKEEEKEQTELPKGKKSSSTTTEKEDKVQSCKSKGKSSCSKEQEEKQHSPKSKKSSKDERRAHSPKKKEDSSKHSTRIKKSSSRSMQEGEDEKVENHNKEKSTRSVAGEEGELSPKGKKSSIGENKMEGLRGKKSTCSLLDDDDDDDDDDPRIVMPSCLETPGSKVATRRRSLQARHQLTKTKNERQIRSCRTRSKEFRVGAPRLARCATDEVRLHKPDAIADSPRSHSDGARPEDSAKGKGSSRRAIYAMSGSSEMIKNIKTSMDSSKQNHETELERADSVTSGSDHESEDLTRSPAKYNLLGSRIYKHALDDSNSMHGDPLPVVGSSSRRVSNELNSSMPTLSTSKSLCGASALFKHQRRSSLQHTGHSRSSLDASNSSSVSGHKSRRLEMDGSSKEMGSKEMDLKISKERAQPRESLSQEAILALGKESARHKNRARLSRAIRASSRSRSKAQEECNDNEDAAAAAGGGAEDNNTKREHIRHPRSSSLGVAARIRARAQSRRDVMEAKAAEEEQDKSGRFMRKSARARRARGNSVEDRRRLRRIITDGSTRACNRRQRRQAYLSHETQKYYDQTQSSTDIHKCFEQSHSTVSTVSTLEDSFYVGVPDMQPFERQESGSEHEEEDSGEKSSEENRDSEWYGSDFFGPFD